MQGILSFSDGEHASKRRKAVRACSRCKDSKKRCTLEPDTHRCKRCTDDRQPCSFESPRSPVDQQATDLGSDRTSNGHVLTGVPDLSYDWPSFSHHGGQETTFVPSPESSAGQELRYTTMLSLMDKKGAEAQPRQHTTTKLISGTSPLSALLRKELKHQIVTNSCSFRTPDPATRDLKSFRRAGCGVHSCNWEKAYSDTGMSAPRVQYLKAIGCFELPPPARCSQLLEIFFAYIHPMLPVIDRKDFLARYYGSEEPPPLIILHALFLAGSRYLDNETLGVTGAEIQGAMSETRTLCDSLHMKLRALIEFDILSDRTAVVQASLIASLHWEGREGLNSSIDSLSLAIRACQEMGLHRKTTEPLSSDQVVSPFQRRLWWSAYTLDRFAAAQEGTPFLINEQDCDVEPLCEEDLAGEDDLTIKTAMSSVCLARLVENVVRTLYRPGVDHTTLFLPAGVAARDSLDTQLQQLSVDIKHIFLSGKEVEQAIDDCPSDATILCGSLLLIHLDAVKILVQRPFLLYKDGVSQYSSWEYCRTLSRDIYSRLQVLHDHNMIRFTWPFTVYALVNCLLIFWYDISSPNLRRHAVEYQEARGNYGAVIRLLKVMGETWWAAAAKHKLAQALALAADEIHSRCQSIPSAEPVKGPTRSHNPGHHSYGNLLSPLSAMTDMSRLTDTAWPDPNLFTDCNQRDYWNSLNLDFDLDVVSNVFHIDQLSDFA